MPKKKKGRKFFQLVCCGLNFLSGLKMFKPIAFLLRFFQVRVHDEYKSERTLYAVYPVSGLKVFKPICFSDF